MKNRREFIKLGGKTLLSVSALSLISAFDEGCADITGENYRVDVHHHIVPSGYVDALKSIGIDQALGKDFPEWSPTGAIQLMDMVNIGTAITSISAPGVYFPDAVFSSEQARIDFAVKLARQCNEYSAKMADDYPGRFGFFAVLPMPIVDASLIEAEYALDVLKAHGVVLLGNYCGTFLGDDSYNELMAELNRRKTIVFEHPSPLPASSQGMGIEVEDFFLEAPVDTTRAVLNLLTSGTLERYSKIRWILSHAGGAIPYLAWRLSLMDVFPKYRVHMPKGVLAYLKKLYYDTALSTSPYAMNSLTELVPSSQILFGSDWPFCTTPATVLQSKLIKELDCFDKKTLLAVERNNSLALFPRLEG
ncbi:MAG: amidohydrolase [bacterium]|nr:amidohydrolase [bacterium]